MKILRRFKKAIKFPKSASGFLDNCIRVEFWKFPVLWGENFSSAINVLTNSPKISDLTKREVLQLNLPESNERIE